MAVGATTPSGATFVAKVSGGGPVRVAVAVDAAMTSPVFTASQAVDAQGVAKVSITGLDPDTAHFYQVEDNSVLDTSVTGRFHTHPAVDVAASFTVAFVGDAGLTPVFPGVAGGELDANRVSNHTAWDTIRTLDPLMVVNLGDWGYPDWGSALTDTLANRRSFYDDNLNQPRQAQLFREIPWVYLYDDHDFAGNDSDGTYANKANAATVYRERVPHYPLDDANAIYQSWQVGRVLFVAADVRYNRSPNGDTDGPSKTMLGAAQKAWMDNLLSTSGAEFLVWCMPQTWISEAADSWASFTTEQAEMIAMFAGHGWAGRMCIVTADAHMVALDSGGNSPGNIPALVAAAIDATPLGDFTLYNLGGQQGRNQYGTLTVVDSGTFMAVTLTGWQGTSQIVTHTIGISLSSPTVVGSAQVVEFAEHVHGSHLPLFEARVLTSFQTGADPAGTTIPIVGGDVRFDNTGDIFASLQLTTGGIDEDLTGESRFPRLAADLLAPYGNEIWVRRGIDLGGEILWSPLGYFRIDAAEQSNAPYGEIAISGQDRMAGIVDARLVQPREFPPGTTVAGVFATMIGEVYPDAIVVFDDDTGFAGIGNTLTFDEDRLATLVELIDAYGKVMYWDGEGILRVESPPDESQPLWEVKAGADGVLVSSGRRVSREGMYNGVVARGEGGDQTTPIFAVAVDIGPTSPTRWGGRFGKVPRFQASPFIKTQAQALAAARATLGRQLGAPHVVSFGAVVNPALRPWHPIRIEQRDSNREVHVVQSVTVPLTADAVMNGETREKTQVLIGQVTS